MVERALAETPGSAPQLLAARALEGHVASGARVIRWLEDEAPEGLEALRLLHAHGGRAQIVGLTGPAGAGKSTLADALVAAWRARDLRVAVLAVDPTSPFSGGALLGDRVRMQRHATDPGVFIRSMATRGAQGGLARHAFEACAVFDAMGYERVLVETLGVGQDELDVVDLAHTSVVVCLPGTGDEVQALKAGLLEVGDCVVLNKADHPAAAAAERDLLQMLHLRRASEEGWEPHLWKTVATRGEGVDALLDAIEAHGARLRADDAFARVSAQRARHALLARLRRGVEMRALAALEVRPEWRDTLAAVEARRLDPYTAADRLLALLAPVEKGQP